MLTSVCSAAVEKGAIRWIFDALPPSGARRGGNPSEHAFRHTLETLVREVIQNANDQAVGWPAVRFRFIELADERLEAFQRAMAWPTLLPHLKGSAATKGGRTVGEFLTKLESTRRLLLLQIEDRNTEGLTGAESDGESHFRALCKDTLYSHKSSDAAGGSYGLGKSVLWTFSGLATVLFNSVLLSHLEGQVSPRLIGRAELPSHALRSARSDKWFTGPGWFGQLARVVRAGIRAESVWDMSAYELASDLCLAREDRHGTSILIVGFRDPTSERTDEVSDLIKRISTATTKFFWPAMVMDMRRLRVSVGDEQNQTSVELGADRSVRPFVDCYRRRAEATASLQQVGDIALRAIPIDLPNRRDGTKGQPGTVDLVVRLAAEGSRDRYLGHVAIFRGPGMVVRYWDRSSLTIGMRPFHAVLVAGHARNPRAPSEADKQVEQFLRAAEPPGHDDWLPTSKLKQSYKRGYAIALRRLKDRVGAELRKLLVLKPTQGSVGPDRLQKRFPIGDRPGGNTESSVFSFTGLTAGFEAGRWHFEGEIESKPNDHGRKGLGWKVRLVLNELGDDGQPMGRIAIDSLVVDTTEDARVTLDDGVALIHPSHRVRSVFFHGHSCQLDEAELLPGQLGIELTSEQTAEGS